MANNGQQRIKDAETKIAGMLKEGAVVKLDGMDPEMAESVAQSIETVLTRYPSTKDAFAGFTTDDTPSEAFAIRESIMAAYSPNSELIHLNNRYYGNKAEFEKVYAEAVGRKFHPEGTTADSVIIHEMGHAIDNYVSKKIIDSFDYSWRGERISTRIWNSDIKSGKKSGNHVTGKSIKEGLSGYASKNHEEYIAEAFAEFVTSSNPRPLAKKIGRRVEQYIRKAEKAGEK